MQSELHGNVVHHGVEVLLLVSMLFLLAIPKSLLIQRNFCTLVIHTAWSGHAKHPAISGQLTDSVMTNTSHDQ